MAATRPQTETANRQASPTLGLGGKGPITSTAEAGPARSLAVAEDRLERCLAEAAHDCRAPLALVRQIIDALRQRLQVGLPASQDELDLLHTAAVRLQQTDRWAEEILTQRRLQEDSLRGTRRRFYPHQWRASIEPLLQGIAQEHGVDLQWIGWESSLPKLYLDADFLSRIVMNLATNAMEASQPGGRVQISAKWQLHVDHRLTLTIEDSGPGLQDGLLQLLSDNPTEREVPSRSRSATIGLGLRNARALCACIAGELEVENKIQGGTRFRLSLAIDDLPCMLSQWLQSQLTTLSDLQQRQLSMHVVCAKHMDLELVDRRLQHAFTGTDFVYRLAKDQWACVGLHASAAGAAEYAATLNHCAENLTRMARQQVAHAHCQLRKVLDEECSQSADGLSLSLAGSIARVARKLCARMEVQLAGRVPPISELQMPRDSILKAPSASASGKGARRQCLLRTQETVASSLPHTTNGDASAMQMEQPLKPALAVGEHRSAWAAESTADAPGQRYEAQPASVAAVPRPMLTQRSAGRPAENEAARQWKLIRSQFARLGQPQGNPCCRS